MIWDFFWHSAYSGVTGTNTPIIETPFAAQVIPQAIIRDRQSRDVKDALTRFPNWQQIDR